MERGARRWEEGRRNRKAVWVRGSHGKQPETGFKNLEQDVGDDL